MDREKVGQGVRRVESVVSAGLTNPAVLLALRGFLRHLDAAAQDALEKGPTDPATQAEGAAALREMLRAVHEFSGTLLVAWETPRGESHLSESRVTRERVRPRARHR
jgi:hypothetical protein